MNSQSRRIEWLLFATALIAFAYFHQGGGWNANARFAMVRAMVEQRTLAIDSYLIYTPPSDSTRDLRRIVLRNAEYTDLDKTNVLVWLNRQGRAFPINQTLEGRVVASDPEKKAVDVQITDKAVVSVFLTDSTRIEPASSRSEPLPIGHAVKIRCRLQGNNVFAEVVSLVDETDLRPVTFVDIRTVAASGDVSYYGGHFFPNKAPGTSFAAVPAYWIIYQVERLIDANPDNWWTLTLNAWLTSALSAGLLSAFGVVLFYRLTLNFPRAAGLPSLLATIAFAFGTMFFPYATCMDQHNIIAACLLASFYLLHRVKIMERPASGSGFRATRAPYYLFLSGLCAGYAAITNYIVAVVVILLALYLFSSVRQKNGWLWFGLGILGPFLLICAYNVACFDTPFTTNYRHQNPYFRSDSAAFLDVFVMPRWNVLITILFSPFRGLFFSSPVLLMAVVGLVLLFRNRDWRAEAGLATAIAAFFVLFNTSFEAWDGGWAVAPRYLGPAVPFLALGLPVAFGRFCKTTCLLGGLSIIVMLLITAVDPQPPVGVSEATQVQGKPAWRYNPLTEYELPIFFGTKSPSPSSDPGDLPAGPVSVNPGGIYGGGLLGPDELRWNSFNAGEFLFPESRWSLLPLLAVAVALAWLALRHARQIKGRPAGCAIPPG